MRVCSFCQRCYDNAVLSCVEEDHPALSKISDDDCDAVTGYRLEYFVGSDSYGDVYRAAQTASGGRCLIRISSASDIGRAQFLEEARLAATFFHPNVADVYEAGELPDGALFAVMEEPGGRSLREFLRTSGTPEILTSIEIVRQVAEAAHALHVHGLVHRRIDPDNITLAVDTNGELLARIQNIDLGGVGQHAIISNKFTIDSALETLRYFAPEQFSGEDTGPRSDVYALGIVFYEMLAGAPPFDASKAAALIEKHKHQPPPEIKIDNFDLRMLIAHTLLESLAKQPWQRQSSANAFARQLRHIEQLATHSSTPPPAIAVEQKPVAFAARAAAASTMSDLPPRPANRPVKIQPSAAVESAEPEVNTVVDLAPEPVIEVTPDDPPEPSIEVKPDDPPEPSIEVKPDDPPAPRSRLKRKRKRTQVSPLPLVAPQDGELATTTQPVEIDIKPIDIVSVPNVRVAVQPAESEPIFSEPASSAPIKIAWQTPDDDIPSVADVREVLLHEQVPAVIEAEPEPDFEITQPRRIEIPIARYQPAEEPTFTLLDPADEQESDDLYSFSSAFGGLTASTLFGRAEANDLSDEDEDEIYPYSSSRSFAVAPYLLAAGGGIAAAMVVLFFVGSFLVNDPLRSASVRPKSSVPLQTSLPKAEPAPVTAAPQVVQTSLDGPVTSPARSDISEPAAQRSAPQKRTDAAPETEIRRDVPEKTTRNDSAPSTVAAGSIVKNPPVSSSVVITYDKEKARLGAENDTRVRVKTASSNPNKADAFTRPRIVSDPR